MHILLIPSWYPQSAHDVHGSFFREQAQALRDAGCRVGIVALTMHSWQDVGRRALWRSGCAASDDDGIATLRACGMYWVPFLQGVKTRTYLRHGEALFAAYVRRYGLPDVIHVHSLLNAGVLARVLHERLHIPYVVTEHNSAFARGQITPALQRRLSPAVCAAARRFAVSQSFCTALSALFTPANGPWEEMPNIVRRDFLLRPLAARKEGAGFTFVAIGFLREVKGFDLLLRAFAAAFSAGAAVTLVIGGDGPQRRMLEGLARELGIGERVHFRGLLSREEVIATLAAGDALAVASHYETFGVAVVEALALGKPVVATRCGGPESIVTPEDGILVEKGSVAALAAGMRELYRGRDGYRAEEIRARCARRYGAEAVMRRLVAVYRQLVPAQGEACEVCSPP